MRDRCVEQVKVEMGHHEIGKLHAVEGSLKASGLDNLG
jgi:hypothetical protein